MRALVLFLPLMTGLGCAGSGTSDTDPADTDPSGDTGSTPAPEPRVLAVAPPSALVGDTVTVTGMDLGETSGTVTVGETQATLESWSTDTIALVIPDVLPGTQDLVVQVDGVALDPLPLEIILPRRVYVSQGLDDKTNDRLSVFEVSVDGSLIEVSGSPFDAGLVNDFRFGGVPGNVALDAAHRRLFVSGQDAVAVFDLDGATGAPTPVTGSPFTAGKGGMFGCAVANDGAHLFVSRYYASDILPFSVSPDGILTPGSPFKGRQADQLLVTPDSRFLYAGTGSSILGFAIGGDGVLTSVGAPVAVATSYGKALHPDGSRLYAASYAAGQVAGFAIDPKTGLLDALPGSPASTKSLGVFPNGLAFHPDGDFAYVAMWESDQIGILAVGTDGSLKATTSVTTVEEPAPLAIASDGSLLFVLGQTGAALEVFAVGDDGGLTSAGTPATFPKPAYPQGLALTGL